MPFYGFILLVCMLCKSSHKNFDCLCANAQTNMETYCVLFGDIIFGHLLFWLWSYWAFQTLSIPIIILFLSRLIIHFFFSLSLSLITWVWWRFLMEKQTVRKWQINMNSFRINFGFKIFVFFPSEIGSISGINVDIVSTFQQ